MADFKNQKERLLLFLRHKELKNSTFEKIMNLSNGYINSMRKGFGYDKLEQISIFFPELNIGWLLTGEGSMLKDDNSTPTSTPTIQTSTPQQEKTVPYYMYKELLEDNLKQATIIGRLQCELDNIKKQQQELSATSSDFHAEIAKKKRSSSHISGSSAQPDAPTIK